MSQSTGPRERNLLSYGFWNWRGIGAESTRSSSSVGSETGRGKYIEQISKLIYTTNAIEGFHRQVRKETKTKGAFPSDMALLKLIYFAHQNISKSG